MPLSFSVLQFDHHCVWLNNCVGYNNYRAFLLTLFYLNLGCWYGIAMLYRPFLQGLNTNGNWWNFFRDNIGIVLELPSVSTLISCAFHGTMENDIIVKIVFPFLLGIGIIQAVFFGYHIFYVVSALTTLEYKIKLEKEFKLLKDRRRDGGFIFVLPRNSFSQGWSQNLRNAFGPISLVFLPVQVEPEQILSVSNASAAKEK